MEEDEAENVGLLPSSEEQKKMKLTCFWIGALIFFAAIGISAFTAPYELMFIVKECNLRNITVSSSNCTQNDDVQKAVAGTLQILTISSSVPQLLMVTIISQLADTIGRKNALVIPIFGSCLNYLVYTFVPPDRIDIMVPCVVVAGFAGGLFSALGIIFSSLADITQGFSGKTRHVIFSATEGFLWIGLLIGPLIGGFLGEMYGPQKSILFPAITSAIASVIVFFFVPETLPPKKRKEFHLLKSNIFTTFKAILSINSTVTRLSSTFFVSMLGVSLISSVAPLFLSSLNYSNQEIGYYQTIAASSNAFGLLVVLPLSKKVGISTKVMLLITFVSLSAYPLFLYLGVHPYVSISLSGFASIMFPTMRAAISAQVSPLEFGVILGGIAALESLGTLVGGAIISPLREVLSFSEIFLVCACLPVLMVMVVISLPHIRLTPMQATEIEATRTSFKEDKQSPLLPAFPSSGSPNVG